MIRLKDGRDPVQVDRAVKELRQEMKDTRKLVEYVERLQFTKPSQKRHRDRMLGKLRANSAASRRPVRTLAGTVWTNGVERQKRRGHNGKARRSAPEAR